MKRITTIALTLLLVLPAAAQEARRIVSLAASITKNIYLLDAGERLVGCTRYCTTDPADGVAVVADAVSVNMERVALLRPDVVLVSGLTHPRVVAGLERLGIKTTRLDQPRDFNDICRQFEQIGEIVGEAGLSREIIRQSRARLDIVKREIAARKGDRPRVFLQIGADPLFAALPGTFMDDYITRAGGANVAAGLSNGIVSREFVVLSLPDVILVTAMGIAGDEQVERWLSIRTLPAARARRVFTLDDDICSPTPVTFVDGVEKITRLIHAAP